MEWISVKDKLPEQQTWVLCWGDGAWLTNKFMIQSYMDYTNKDSSWFKSCFTHWMPLPEPPKQ